MSNKLFQCLNKMNLPRDDSLILITKIFHFLLKLESSWVCIICPSLDTLVTEHHMFIL